MTAEELDRLVRLEGRRDLLPELQPALDALAIEQFGLRFRYIPGGVFDMGRQDGEPDERPTHAVSLQGFWMTDVPLSWLDYCRLMDWELPPTGRPKEPPAERMQYFGLMNDNKIRLQYCEDATMRARDWHAHAPDAIWMKGGKKVAARELFGEVDRQGDGPWKWSAKPMVAVSWQSASALAERLDSPGIRIQLPTEAQWERAARGARQGAMYRWADAPPTRECCDFEDFSSFAVAPSRSLPANDYGLYGMCRGVWEWCVDHYDAEHYQRSPPKDPSCQLDCEQREHVLRGGSWANCAEAVGVSLGNLRRSTQRRPHSAIGSRTPTIGFRLVRTGSR